MLKLRTALCLEGLQLPFKRALQVAAELGAEAIEVNARSDIRPAELSRTGVRHIKKLLNDYQLSICCVSFPTRRGYADPTDLDRRLDGTKAAMTMAYDLGCNVVSNRIGPVPAAGSPEHATLTQALEDIGRHGQRVGAFLAARTGNASGEELGELIASLGPGSLCVDFDPAELMVAGHDVNLAMTELAGHVIHFRARDAVRELSRSENVLVQLGRGSIDFPTLLASLEEHHYSGFITVQSPGHGAGPAVLGEQMEYLANVFA